RARRRPVFDGCPPGNRRRGGGRRTSTKTKGVTFVKDLSLALRYLISINTRDIMPAHRDDSIATRASLLGRLKNWEDQASWQEFTETYSRLILGVAIQAGLTEAEAKDVEQETLLRVAQTIHEFESNPARGSLK